MAFMDFFRKKNSGEIAKDRLKLLLISDRANCSPEIMEAIKNDIIKVITKYMEIDSPSGRPSTSGTTAATAPQTESEGGNGTVPVLCANIPVKDMKTRS